MPRLCVKYLKNALFCIEVRYTYYKKNLAQLLDRVVFNQDMLMRCVPKVSSPLEETSLKQCANSYSMATPPFLMNTFHLCNYLCRQFGSFSLVTRFFH